MGDSIRIILQDKKRMIKMRKYMTKEVTFTTVKATEIVVEKGEPKLVKLTPIIMLGDLTIEKAQKKLQKETGTNAQVYAIESDTKTYKMKVSDFIKVAEEVTEGDNTEDEDDDEDE